MLKEKLNRLYQEKIEEDKAVNFVNTKHNICGQMWHKINLGDRQEIMRMETKEYKTIQAKFNSYVRIIENMIEV